MSIQLVSALISLLMLVGTSAASAAESKQPWQIDWDKIVKAAEDEGEINVYVVDYPRFAVSQFQKAFPKLNEATSRAGI